MFNICKCGIILIFIISCSKNNPLNKDIIKIDPETASAINQSSIIKNIEYIKLSTEDNSFIGDIEKIRITESRIYILDSYYSLALYVFDRKGDLLFKIANYGKGPGEFMGPYDFTLDEVNNQIAIYDARTMKLCLYSLDGKFIEDKLLDFRFRRFEAIDGKYIFYMDNPLNRSIDNNIIITDHNLNVIEEHVKINNEMRGFFFLLPVNFSKYNKQYFFTAHSDYSIYEYSNNTFSKNVSIDFGSRNAPSSYYKKYENNEDRWEARGDAAFNISNYFESDNYIFFLYQINTTTYYYFKSKKNDQVIHTNNELLIDDMNVGPFIRWPKEIIDNKLVWYQESSKLLEYLGNKKQNLNEKEWKIFSDKNPELISFSETINEGDNPYLILMDINF